jgi:hypothetical protein
MIVHEDKVYYKKYYCRFSHSSVIVGNVDTNCDNILEIHFKIREVEGKSLRVN